MTRLNVLKKLKIFALRCAHLYIFATATLYFYFTLEMFLVTTAPMQVAVAGEVPNFLSERARKIFEDLTSSYVST